MFRLTKGGKLIEGIFKGETINTPSMLAVEDAIVSLEWAKEIGGASAMKARADANAAALDAIVEARHWLGHLVQKPAIRSNTSVCLTVKDADAGFIKQFAKLLEDQDAAYDIAGYRDAPPGLRIWCGVDRRHRGYRGARPVARLGLRPADRLILPDGRNCRFRPQPPEIHRDTKGLP